MDQKHALVSLVESLEPKIGSHGFLLRGNLFVREGAGRQEIVQPGAVRKSMGRVGLLYGARVRFPALERLIHGNSADASHSGSYGGLSHLIAEKGYYDWTIEAPDAIPVVAEAVFANIMQVAFPFFDDHVTLDSLLRALRTHKRPLGLSPEDQVVYRAAALWQLGSREESRKMLTDALEERVDQLPKKRVQIESLFRRLEVLT